MFVIYLLKLTGSNLVRARFLQILSLLLLFFDWKSSIYMSFFRLTCFFYMKGNYFWFPARELHYQIQNFVAGNLRLNLSADSKFFWSSFLSLFSIVFLLNVEWLRDEVAYVVKHLKTQKVVSNNCLCFMRYIKSTVSPSCWKIVRIRPKRAFIAVLNSFD